MWALLHSDFETFVGCVIIITYWVIHSLRHSHAFFLIVSFMTILITYAVVSYGFVSYNTRSDYSVFVAFRCIQNVRHHSLAFGYHSRIDTFSCVAFCGIHWAEYATVGLNIGFRLLVRTGRCQVILPSHPTKSSCQAILPSHPTKPILGERAPLGEGGGNLARGKCMGANDAEWYAMMPYAISMLCEWLDFTHKRHRTRGPPGAMNEAKWECVWINANVSWIQTLWNAAWMLHTIEHAFVWSGS